MEKNGDAPDYNKLEVLWSIETRLSSFGSSFFSSLAQLRPGTINPMMIIDLLTVKTIAHTNHLFSLIVFCPRVVRALYDNVLGTLPLWIGIVFRTCDCRKSIDTSTAEHISNFRILRY